MNRELGISFVAGIVFAIGLGLSGMTNPNKVIDFLNPAGGWDPSLAFVMVGGIGFHMLTYRWIVGRGSPLFGGRFGIPTRSDITPQLVLGAALFGVGWALGGVCPGPGLVSLATGSAYALTFVGTMSAGMALYHVVDTALLSAPAAPPKLEPQPNPLTAAGDGGPR